MSVGGWYDAAILAMKGALMRSKLIMLLLLAIAAGAVLLRRSGTLPVAVAQPSAAEQALERPIAEVWFERVPLEGALKELEKSAGVRIRIDASDLADATIDAGMPVTCRQHNRPLLGVLDAIIGQLPGRPVHFAPQGREIVISTKESIVVRVYDVRDLSYSDLRKLLDPWAQLLATGFTFKWTGINDRLVLAGSWRSQLELRGILARLRERTRWPEASAVEPKWPEPATDGSHK